MEALPFSRHTPDFRLLLGAELTFMLGFAIYNTVFINFAAQEIQITPRELGILESVREIPGLLSVAIAAITMWLLEPVLASIALVVMAVGVFNYVHIDTVAGLVLFSLVWSIGFHTWAPLGASMALRMGREGEEARRLGLFRSTSNVGGLIGIGAVFLLVRFLHVPFRPMFVFSGVAILCATLLLLRIKRGARVRQQRIVLRKRYWLYYVLQFLDGTRRHIFMTFALFLLVREHGAGVQTISILSFVNQIFSIGAAYLAGRLIDKRGERPVLAFGYAALTFIFLGYAFIDTVMVLFALYVIDNIFFSISIGIQTYAKKTLIKESDLRPTMVAGQTMNHVAAVVIPITGGLLWEAYGHAVPFLMGSAVAAIAVIASLQLKIGKGPVADVGQPSALPRSETKPALPEA